MREFKKEEEYPYYGYADLLDSFELDEVLSGCAGDYQGDLFSLFKDGSKYGYLVFGYGSCSGCDTLEAVQMDEGYEGIKTLRDSLFGRIKWGTGKKVK